MKIDIPVQAVPQLFFELGLFNEVTKDVLSAHIEHDNTTALIARLAELGFELDDEPLPTTCKELTFNVDLPDKLLDSAKKDTSKSQCNSIW